MATAKAPVFTYTGTTRGGKKTTGEITAASSAVAKAKLRGQGINATQIKKKSKPITLFGGGGKKITSEDITVFTRQMATMMKAGVPLVQAFEIVEEGLENKNMAAVVNAMRNEVSAGGNFASALRAHPKYFDDLFCSLVESGEQAGALETMLDRVAIYKEKSESVKKKVRKAIKYPITILIIAAIVTAILLIKVVPVFANMFASFGAELPLPTQVVMNISNWVTQKGLLLLVIFGVAGFCYQQAHQRSLKFRQFLQRLTLKLPVFGDIIRISSIARYARTLSTTFAAGVPLVEALDSAAGASGNIVFETAIINIRNEVTSGSELAASMKAEGVFPSMLIQMVSIGEQAGALDEMLSKAASIYEEEVDTQVDGLTSMMEPMIMAFLGVVVGGLIVSMYLPIFQMGAVVG